ncbi:MAG TPA: hypothetical protein VG711_04885, partial [Phycisphaerales bacterium]|nr:hypothetical protein [Phycisphaerales bacterium]
LPVNPLDSIVTSDYIEFTDDNHQTMTIEYNPVTETLSLLVTDPDTGDTTSSLLLENVKAQVDADGNPVSPFTLEYEKGRYLYRATVDLAIVPDDNMSVALDGNNTDTIRLVASAMPRFQAY